MRKKWMTTTGISTFILAVTLVSSFQNPAIVNGQPDPLEVQNSSPQAPELNPEFSDQNNHLAEAANQRLETGIPKDQPGVSLLTPQDQIVEGGSLELQIYGFNPTLNADDSNQTYRRIALQSLAAERASQLEEGEQFVMDPTGKVSIDGSFLKPGEYKLIVFEVDPNRKDMAVVLLNPEPIQFTVKPQAPEVKSVWILQQSQNQLLVEIPYLPQGKESELGIVLHSKKQIYEIKARIGEKDHQKAALHQYISIVNAKDYSNEGDWNPSFTINIPKDLAPGEYELELEVTDESNQTTRLSAPVVVVAAPVVEQVSIRGSEKTDQEILIISQPEGEKIELKVASRIGIETIETVCIDSQGETHSISASIQENGSKILLEVPQNLPAGKATLRIALTDHLGQQSMYELAVEIAVAPPSPEEIASIRVGQPLPARLQDQLKSPIEVLLSNKDLFSLMGEEGIRENYARYLNSPNRYLVVEQPGSNLVNVIVVRQETQQVLFMGEMKESEAVSLMDNIEDLINAKTDEERTEAFSAMATFVRASLESGKNNLSEEFLQTLFKLIVTYAGDTKFQKTVGKYDNQNQWVAFTIWDALSQRHQDELMDFILDSSKKEEGTWLKVTFLRILFLTHGSSWKGNQIQKVGQFVADIVRDANITKRIRQEDFRDFVEDAKELIINAVVNVHTRLETEPFYSVGSARFLDQTKYDELTVQRQQLVQAFLDLLGV